MISLKALRSAAREVVQVLGLIDKNKKDIIISTDMDADDLIKIITDAIPLIDPKLDKFTEATQEVLDELENPQEEDEEDKEEEEENKEEEEDDQEAAEKIHEKNVGSKKVNEGRKVVKEDEEEEEEEKPVKKERTPREKNTTGKTKKSIIEEMIATKKGATVEEMAQRIVDEGIDSDYKKNLVVTKLWLSKMGFPTNKAAIEKNPYFKKK